MSDFTLIDLDSQADAVAQHIKGWSKQEILNWLSQYGEVRQILYPRYDNIYGFCSYIGIRTSFSLPKDGQLVIFGNHTGYKPK